MGHNEKWVSLLPGNPQVSFPPCCMLHKLIWHCMSARQDNSCVAVKCELLIYHNRRFRGCYTAPWWLFTPCIFKCPTSGSWPRNQSFWKNHKLSYNQSWFPGYGVSIITIACECVQELCFPSTFSWTTSLSLSYAELSDYLPDCIAIVHSPTQSYLNICLIA